MELPLKAGVPRKALEGVPSLLYALAGNSFLGIIYNILLEYYSGGLGKDLEVQCRILRVINAVLTTYFVSFRLSDCFGKSFALGAEILIVCVL